MKNGFGLLPSGNAVGEQEYSKFEDPEDDARIAQMQAVQEDNCNFEGKSYSGFLGNSWHYRDRTPGLGGSRGHEWS